MDRVGVGRARVPARREERRALADAETCIEPNTIGIHKQTDREDAIPPPALEP
jgi:hypothetical protein